MIDVFKFRAGVLFKQVLLKRRLAGRACPRSAREACPPKSVSWRSWMISRSQRQVMRIMLRLVWLTPYMGSSAMRSCAFLMASTSMADRMLSICSFVGLCSVIMAAGDGAASNRAAKSAGKLHKVVQRPDVQEAHHGALGRRRRRSQIPRGTTAHLSP